MDFQQFMSTVPPQYDEYELYQHRREPLLNYVNRYEYLASNCHQRFRSTWQKIIQTPDEPHFGAAGLRAEKSITYLCLQYSAGTDLQALRTFYPSILWAWEEARRYKMLWHDSEDFTNSLSNRVPVLSFADAHYGFYGLPLVCFGLLLGHADLMPRLCWVWDYINEELDYFDILLERLASPFVPGRNKAAKQYTRHLPYRKLDKVFKASPEARPALMAKYLDEWYHASRREPYYNKDDDIVFTGYWSYEAAAVTWLLGIDDTSYRDMDFYPRDLADFARQFSPQPPIPTGLTAYPGDICPETGEWYAIHLGGKKTYIEAGQTMPGPTRTATGNLVIWYLQRNR